ncbi:MAG: hypothetical protein K2X00_23645 [Nitrospiraceae bacterium]|nr:hypothetical protein [Nitrospiraceae bacterium]
MIAAIATLALKAGVWFRRGRLGMVSPDSRAQRARRQTETPLIVLCGFPGPALSAAGGVQRAGFERMVAEVCLGKVSAVCAREVSRFARNSRDW